MRNLSIFAVVTLGSGWLGIAVDQATETADPQQGLGILLWILLPMTTGLLLRALGGDGWQDAGLKPRLQAGWRWYVVALLLFPFVSLLVFGLGALFGAFAAPATVAPSGSAIVSLVAIGFASSFVKNILEEFAWRGYLTPRLAATTGNPWRIHLLTGLIWAGWHIPYWIYFVDVRQFTALPLPVFAASAAFTLVITAVTYGELRLLSHSVWPGVILHSVANGITAALVLHGLLQFNGGAGILFSPGNDGLVHSILFAVAGVGLYQYRVRRLAV
jgi:membrane protease YdiL (CAAX protease family)